MQLHLFKNASWSSLLIGIRAVTGLLSTLLAIRLLGPDQYGTIATYLSIFLIYLSLNSSFYTIVVIKLIASDRDKQQHVRCAVIAIATRFCIWSLLILCGVTLLLSLYVTQKTFIVFMQPKIFDKVILLMGVLTAVQICAALQAAMIEGAGRLDLMAKCQLISPFVTLIMLSINLFIDNMVDARIYLIVLCVAGTIDLVLLWSIRRLLYLSLIFRSYECKDVVSAFQLLRSGSLLQATSMLNLFLEPANKILLNYFSGPVVVASYDLAMRVFWGIQHLVSAPMRVFLYIDQNDCAEVGRIFGNVIKLLSVTVIAIHIIAVIFLFFVARYQLMIHETQLVIFSTIATVSNFGMIFITPLYLNLIGNNDLKFIFRTQFVLVSINILMTAVAVPFFGLVGAAFGLLMATFINFILIYLRCHINASVYDDPEIQLSQFKIRVATMLTLLLITIIWAITGGKYTLVLFAVILYMIFILVREPLVSKLINYFFPRIFRRKF